MILQCLSYKKERGPTPPHSGTSLLAVAGWLAPALRTMSSMKHSTPYGKAWRKLVYAHHRELQGMAAEERMTGPLFQTLLWVDLLANVATLGRVGETLSLRAAKAQRDGKMSPFHWAIKLASEAFEHDHLNKTLVRHERGKKGTANEGSDNGVKGLG